ncbi:hypothetical protein ACOME3_009992 [Neoechinorhynchus agilis]
MSGISNDPVSEVSMKRREFCDILECVFHVTFGDFPFGNKRAGYAVVLDDLSGIINDDVITDLSTVDMFVIVRLRMHKNELRKAMRIIPTNSYAQGSNFPPLFSGIDYIFDCYRNLMEYAKRKPNLNESLISGLSNTLVNYGKSQIEDEDGILSVNTLNGPVLGPMSGFRELFCRYPENEYVTEYFTRLFASLDASGMKRVVVDVLTKSIANAKDDHMPNTSTSSELSWISRLLESYTEFTKAFVSRELELLLSWNDIALNTRQSWILEMMSKSFLPSIVHRNLVLTLEIADMTETGLVNESVITRNTWSIIAHHVKSIFSIIRKLLVDPSNRPIFIKWLVGVSNLLIERTKIHVFQTTVHHVHLIGDGFLLNITLLTLLFVEPIIDKDNSALIDKHYPSCRYASMRGIFQDIPVLFPAHVCNDGTNECNCADGTKFNFSTEIFFLSHYLLNIFYNRITGLIRIFKRHQEAAGNYLETLYEDDDIEDITNNRAAQALKDSIAQHNFAIANLLICMFFTELCDAAFKLLAFTARVYSCPTSSNENVYCIPEFVLDNFNQRIKCDMVLPASPSGEMQTQFPSALLAGVLNFIVDLMSKNHDIRNPHLRASFADSLNGLCRSTSVQATLSRIDTDAMLAAILNTFVLIEVNDQSVEFEEKYHYRLSLHEVIQRLSKEAEHNWPFIETMRRVSLHALTYFDVDDGKRNDDVPMFLRFINLLLNDATFLLDESLELINQLKVLEEQLESHDTETHENHVLLTRQCKYRTTLSASSLETLRAVSRTCHTFLGHPQVAPRIATMINYFLYKLCGPNRVNLRVNDMASISFEPKRVVKRATLVHINLMNEPAYVQAVYRDLSTTYSNQIDLFKSVFAVLQKPSMAHMGIGDQFNEFTRKVSECAKDQTFEDFPDAPDEFLDPITSEMMLDPVCLPTSHVSIDRSTIVRHLLSDQTDPFNRQPLQMKDVTPDTQLKFKIQQWLKERKHSKRFKPNEQS